MIKFSNVLILFFLYLVSHAYLFNGLGKVWKDWRPRLKNILVGTWWTWGGILMAAIWTLPYLPTELYRGPLRSILMTMFFLDMAAKVPMLVFFLIDDLGMLGRNLLRKARVLPEKKLVGEPISRKEFLKKAGIIAGGLPFAGFSFGIAYGAYDYQWRKVRIAIPNLPGAWEGVKIGQLSDIHTGSFFRKQAVAGGLQTFMEEKPDLVFFTGDLVNNLATEMIGWTDVFSKVKAPLGVYSILGNHDYGDYSSWPTEAKKRANFEGVLKAHKEMGWNLLRNENRVLTINGSSMALLGIENWGARHRFKKYGDMAKTYLGSEDKDFRILLSHDPSHWDAQVRPEYSDIELTLSGHTHGFQMGIENEFIKWSPAQYIYEQWAGLYKKGNQQIYVNRGFGFIGYPGRLGIAPEITLIELVKG